MASPPSYIVVPQTPTRTRGFTVNNSNNTTAAGTTPVFIGQQMTPSAAAATAATSTYRPPAHKHAHHLHSIPPREKSTRTLIIDHMLWVHGE